MILGLDIETFSAADIDNGSEAYAQHESTGVYCAVWSRSTCRDDVETVRWFPGSALPSWVVEGVESGVPVVAHNASFEAAIVRNILHVAHGWPLVASSQWLDTLAIAASLSLPRGLDALGKVLSARVLKDEEGAKLMRILARVREADGTFVFPEPTRGQLVRLCDYCEQDVLAMMDCYWVMPRPTIDEQSLVIVDRAINERGVMLDIPFMNALADIAAQRVEQIDTAVWDATHDLLTVTDPGTLKLWVKEQGVELPKVRKKLKSGWQMVETLDRTAVQSLIERDDTPAHVADVLSARVESGRVASLAKLKRAPAMVNRDGRLLYALRYCGAHTGRWASSGLQLHNLAKANFGRPGEAKSAGAHRAVAAREAAARGDLASLTAIWPNALQAMSMLLRSAVIAAPGFDLIGGDYSAIEARVLAWLAGHSEVLDLFHAGKDVYVAAAEAIGSDDRQLGKVMVLALGYGMGPIKFRDTAAKMGIMLSLKEARRVQRLWRSVNEPIVQFWNELADAFAAAMKPGSPKIRLGKLLFIPGKNCLRVELPSGRCLHYWRPHRKQVTRRIETVTEAGEIVVREVEMNELRFYKSKGSTMQVESTYGGKLAENFTQAIARDLLGAALLRFDLTSYPIILHVHDSAVAEVPSGTGSTDEFAEIMSTNPTWAYGLPTAVEAYRSPYFKG